ncbi:MAG TPA: protein BatD [Thiolapillus brandeum]|uniref:Protein BatD n=1 Tax=Thiolapillus brandeum TaxID=1076588 RepID=A0A7C5N9L5_9GAMM|nr:protein BatD [Thiolapillus brandeum]
MRHPIRIPGEWILRLLWLLPPWLLAGVAWAASVEVSVDRDPVSLDESFQITFTVRGEVQGQPDFSVLEREFQVLGTSRSLRTTFVNGKMERRDQYLVSVMARRAGKLTIPPVSFGKDRSPPLTVTVTEPPPDAGVKGEIFMEVSVDSEAPYLQQQVLLTVRIFHRIQWREASLSEPRFRGGEVLVERLGDDRHYQSLRDGQSWQVIERRYALFPQASGRLEMEPLLLDLRVPSGKRSARQRSPFGDPFFDDFFSRQDYVRKVVRSKPLLLEVKPVPGSFTGKRWLPARSLRLEERWSSPPEKLKAGEPVTRTVTLVADGVTLGQLPELSLPEVPGLRIYADDSVTREEAVSGGVRATATRKFAIIPVREGEYELPAMEIRWWNLATDAEVVARLPARRLNVAPGAASLSGGSVPPVADATPTPAPVQGTRGAEAPVAMTGGGGGTWMGWLVAGNLALFLLWLVTLVAWLRARRRAATGERSAEEGPLEEQGVDARAAWKRLHRAAVSQEAEAMRDALLEVATVLWPQAPPRSLEALARRTREPLKKMLLQLSRQLYGNGEGGWEGTVMEREMKRLAEEEGRAPAATQGGLKPLYPA